MCEEHRNCLGKGMQAWWLLLLEGVELLWLLFKHPVWSGTKCK